MIIVLLDCFHHNVVDDFCLLLVGGVDEIQELLLYGLDLVSCGCVLDKGVQHHCSLVDSLEYFAIIGNIWYIDASDHLLKNKYAVLASDHFSPMRFENFKSCSFHFFISPLEEQLYYSGALFFCDVVGEELEDVMYNFVGVGVPVLFFDCCEIGESW